VLLLGRRRWLRSVRRCTQHATCAIIRRAGGNTAVLVGKRKALGAYYTPVDLAQYLARWAIVSPKAVILEPSVGRGALVGALVDRLDGTMGGMVVGCEIDKEAFLAAKTTFEGRPVILLNADFLELTSAAITSVDAVVANPPFTRNHQLSARVRQQLKTQSEFSDIISGAPGLWVYFLLSSLSFLRLGGRVAFVAPAAVAFADYATPLLRVLRDRFQTVTVVSINERVAWEGTTQERASLVLAAGFGLGPAPEIQQLALSLSTGETSVFAAPKRWAMTASASVLGELARIEIGVVTGANAWFVLDQARAAASDLPQTALVPILSRARQVRGLEITKAEVRGMAEAGERTLLFRPEASGPKGGPIRTYLAKILKAKRRRVLWFSKRNPWWKVQLGRSCDAILTYMNNTGPRIALTEQGLRCTNTLHRLHFINRDPAHARSVSASMLTTFTQVEAERIGRVYGGGVLKFELKDARKLPLLLPTTPINSAVFTQLDAALRDGGIGIAIDLADEAILPHFFGCRWMQVQSEMREELAFLRARRGIGTDGVMRRT
jgi:adenine-specific DNA-methyltransferase